MFPAFCLATYFLFSSYWLLKNQYKKKKQKQDTLIKAEVKQTERKIEKNHLQKIELNKDKTQANQSQILLNSVKDELDNAMIQNQELDKNIEQEPSLIQSPLNRKNEIIQADDEEVAHKQGKKYTPILKNLIGNHQEYESDEDPPSPFASYMIQRQKRLKQNNFRQSQKQKPQEQSELQIIRALSNQRSSNKLSQPSSQIVLQVDQKQREEDTAVSNLIQQMDSLFSHDPSSLLRLMNRYKIQESPVQIKNIHHEKQYEMQERIQQLKTELERKNSQMGIKQIQIFEYKSANDGKQAEVQSLKVQKGELEQKILQLQRQNMQLKQKLQKIMEKVFWKQKNAMEQIKNTEKQKQLEKMIEQIQSRNEELEGQLQQLQVGVTDIELKQVFFKNERKEMEQKLLQSKILLKSKEKQMKGLKQEFSSQNQKKQVQYKNKLEEIARKQSTQEKNKLQLLSVKSDNSNLHLQMGEKYKNDCAYFPISTRQNLAQSSISEGNQKYSNEDPHKTIQNLKNQIEFAQTQMRMLQSSEASHLQKIQCLQKIIEQRSSPEVMDLRAKIFKLQPLADQYEVMRKKYLQMKIHYQTFLHEKQKKKQKIAAYFNGKKDSPTSQIIPASLNRNSPKQSYKSYNNQNSPVNSGKSAISHSQSNESKNNGCYRFLFDCEFVVYQDRQFIYDTLSKLLKGIIKTEKLYNSKTNREKNPHLLIDNIRGILVVIQLQNKKIIGAYTHEPFSQIHPHSTKQNIGFLLDVANRKSFANQSGINSISYVPGSLVWGFNQIMLKYEEPQVLYTNFCRNHNIYWDGRHKIDQFIGFEKQWAPIVQYELFRVSKI